MDPNENTAPATAETSATSGVTATTTSPSTTITSAATAAIGATTSETDSTGSPSTTDTSPVTSGTDATPEPSNAASSTATFTVCPKKVRHTLESELQFLRVPFEHYKKSILPNHRLDVKEVSSVLSSVVNLADSSGLSMENAVPVLNSLKSRLQDLKRKLEEGSQEEDLLAKRCQTRLECLESVDVNNFSDWNDKLVKRMFVDYMLRMSYYETAAKLTESFDIQEDLVDIDVFQEAKTVIDALRNKDVTPALAWCDDNKSRLKKSKSKFKFQLRLQEYIELVRAGDYVKAVEFARKYLAPWGPTHLKEFQHVFAAMAYKSTTQCERYKVLFEPKQWENLVDQFKVEFCRLYHMTPESLLNIYLHAGFTLLKSPYCGKDKCPPEDPLSDEIFMKAALHLPYIEHEYSQTLCYISKEKMDSENYPQALPNGYVYSFLALLEMAYENKGTITCPRTGYVCNYSNVKKVFVL